MTLDPMNIPKPGDLDWPSFDPPPRPPSIIRGRPLTPSEIEELIAEYIFWLEDATTWLEERGISAAVAERRYKELHASRVHSSAAKTASKCDAAATMQTGEELQARLVSAALVDSMREAIRVRRGVLDALRTLASSARAAMYDGRA